MTKTLIAAGLAAAAIAAPASAARTGQEYFRATISAAGLDLRDRAGQAELLARAGRAADRVCGITDRAQPCRDRFAKAAQARIAAVTPKAA